MVKSSNIEGKGHPGLNFLICTVSQVDGIHPAQGFRCLSSGTHDAFPLLLICGHSPTHLSSPLKQTTRTENS